MACPYFYPAARIERGAGARAMPLGDAWSGHCQASPEQPFLPREGDLIPLCNLGYPFACPRFPRGGGADATRFSVSRDQDGIVRIYYVIEKGHLPVENGVLAYSRETRLFLMEHRDRLVQRQAEAYLESYLLRKNSPAHAPTQVSQRIGIGILGTGPAQ